jgi:diguanylate cyclase (GGDEF)-like protein
VTTFTILHWYLVLEPGLRADAHSHARALAQAQASGIEQRLGGGDSHLMRRDLERALDSLLTLEDDTAGVPFMRRITLEIDESQVGLAPGSLDMARGVQECPESRVFEIPLYQAGDGQRIGLATFYASAECLESLAASFRVKLLWSGALMLGFIGFAWLGAGRLLRRLGESEANLRSLFEAAPMPMVLRGQGDAGVRRANQAAKDYLGLREGEDGCYTSPVWQAFEAAGLPADAADRRDTSISTAEGDERWALVSATTLQLSQGPSQLVTLVDVSELKAVQKELLAASVTDGLTGLYNRGYLFQRLTEEIDRARRYAYPLSVIMLDLDHFKRVNDTFGHRVGDEVLARVAATLRAAIRDVDIAGRYGGEEFLVILPFARAADALRVAERIRAGIEDLVWAQPGLRVTVSGGVCEYAGLDIDAFVDAADRKLYEAKSAGRNRLIG